VLAASHLEVHVISVRSMWVDNAYLLPREQVGRRSRPVDEGDPTELVAMEERVTREGRSVANPIPPGHDQQVLSLASESGQPDPNAPLTPTFSPGRKRH
jgi:hypothetical protein